MPIKVLKGKVIGGKKVGRKIGFPTINIAVPRSKVKKTDWGVYFSLVKIESMLYPGITHLGPAKTFNFIWPTCETHILGFKNDLYEQIVEKRLLFKVREIEKFKSLNKLKKQIKKDAKLARKYFGL
ncbi:MAG: riboflavin kinase [Candidatus Buchananbacteria bacterium]